MTPLVLPGVDVLPPAATRPRLLGQFDTPADVAADIAELARPEGERYVEPSAGEGNLVEALLDAGATFVHAVEIDPLRATRLRLRFPSTQVEVVEADWLSFAVPTDWPRHYAGNPPYDKGADTHHVAKMLDHARRLTLLLRTVFLHSQTRRDLIWERAHLAALHPYHERVEFWDEGGKIDVSIFSIVRADRGGVPAVHDTEVRFR